MTLKEEVKLLREKVELLEKLHELEQLPIQPIRYDYWLTVPPYQPYRETVWCSTGEYSGHQQ
jgi:hypothetical protein